MKVDPPILVLVEWEDARVVDDSTWSARTDAAEADLVTFQQVGWLLFRNNRHLVLTSTLSSDIMAARDAIPTATVKRIVSFDPAFGEPLAPIKRARK